MRILFLSRWFPFPPDNGSKIRVFNLLKHLATRYSVDLLSFSSAPVDKTRVNEMRKYCDRVESVIFREIYQSKLQMIQSLLSPEPLHLQKTHSADMQSRVDRVVQEQVYDLVVASQMAMVPYAAKIPGMRKIFEEIELTMFYDNFQLETQKIKRWRNWLTWIKTTRYIKSSLERFDAGTVVSEIERQRVKQIYQGDSPVCIIPNGVDFPSESIDFGPSIPDTLIFSGPLTYDVNLDGISFFTKEIFPLVKAARPDVKLLVTGKLDGVQIDDLPNKEWITFTGYLDDVRPVVATSWASIVPLRRGGGTRLKIIEALSFGVPVITTSKGAEGLDLVPQRDVLIADQPEIFANCILDVLGDSDLREKIGQAGRRNVMQKYDWNVIGPEFCNFIDDVVKNGGKN